MTADSIYQPIRPEMAQVERKLNEVASTAPGDIVELLRYVLKGGGKRLRPALTLLAARFYEYNVDLLIPTAAATEVLHTATLVHDDTVDESDLRRGRTTINHLWGNSNAILLGDYLFAASARMTAETGNVRVIKLFSETLMKICSGEIQESLNPYNKSREVYYTAIGNKTASLLSAATESGAILSGAPEDVVQCLRDYGHNLGMAFQIVDDILDFTGRKETLGKPVASDMARGVFTLPVILLLEKSDSPIHDILDKDKQKGIRLLMEMIQRSSVIEECYEVVQGFCQQARLCLEHLPRNSAHDALTELVDYVTERKN
ncbi:MAG: polyprenyl synthetase family protein [Chloroflexi bacterium]|nr:MAG: polyprenyl synthetase family protein [Chloroflexota bacterium]